MSIRSYLGALKRLLKENPYVVSNPDHIDGRSVIADSLFDMAMYSLAAVTERPFLLQVGANHGMGPHDQFQLIKRLGIHALMIEPQPEAFEQLQKNYSELSTVSCCNAAIAAAPGTLPLFRIAKAADCFHKDGKKFGSGIASFDESHPWNYFKQHANPAGLLQPKEKIIEAIDVDCLDFDSLRRRYEIEKVDALFIDTEGFDYQVLKLVPIQELKPSIIQYENKHLGSEKSKSWEYLSELGYVMVNNRRTGDTIALSRTWTEGLGNSDQQKKGSTTE